MKTLHDLIKKELPKGRRPWDYRLFPPISLQDEPVLHVSVKWQRDDEWEDYRYTISLNLVVEEQNP